MYSAIVWLMVTRQLPMENRNWAARGIILLLLCISHTTMRIPITPEGWTNMGTIPGLFAEYDSRDAGGNILDLSRRKTEYEGRGKEAGKGSCWAVVTKEDVEKLTCGCIIQRNDGWNPRVWMKKNR